VFSSSDSSPTVFLMLVPTPFFPLDAIPKPPFGPLYMNKGSPSPLFPATPPTEEHDSFTPPPSPPKRDIHHPWNAGSPPSPPVDYRIFPPPIVVPVTPPRLHHPLKVVSTFNSFPFPRTLLGPFWQSIRNPPFLSLLPPTLSPLFRIKRYVGPM